MSAVKQEGTLAQALAAWASTLSIDDIPERVRAYVRTQILSQLGSVRASLAHPVGRRIVDAFGSPVQPAPDKAAFTLAALSIALDFDDTAYAGHLSHSTVNVPLGFASTLCLSGAQFVAAVTAANEVAGRIGAAATLGPLRGQTATHVHLVGSAAAYLRCSQAPAEVWTNALVLALSQLARPVSRGFFHSDAKLFAASNAVRAGLDACTAARSGFIGAPDLLEHPDGFLASVAAVPLPEAVTAGLGSRWHSETFSFKAYPGSAYIGSAVDAAVALHRALGDIDPADIESIVVHGSLFTVLLDRAASSLDTVEARTLPGLSFSLGYNIATALLTGGLGWEDLTEPALSQEQRWALAARVSVRHDPQLTERALHSTAPIGEALAHAGARASEWLNEQTGHTLPASSHPLRPPADTFATATKELGATVTVRLSDGRELSHTADMASGAVGWADAPTRHALVRSKFLATGGSDAVADAVERIDTLSAEELTAVLRRALS